MKPPRVPDRVLEAPEPSRARYPDHEGFVERDGVRLFYEVYGEGKPTLLLFYPWGIIHSRSWKTLIPYLSRRFRVVTFDSRGGGKSDKPRGVAAYGLEQHSADVLAVMDATGTDQAILVTISVGARVALWLAAHHGERVTAAAMIGPFVPLTPWPPDKPRRLTFMEPRASRRALITGREAIKSLPEFFRSPSLRRFARAVSPLDAFGKFNAHYWRKDQAGFAAWFVETIAMPERHSTRQIENIVGYCMATDPESMIDGFFALDGHPEARLAEPKDIGSCCERVRCPVLVLHGELDLASPLEWGAALAAATSGRLVTFEGCGHDLRRHPVRLNLELRAFTESVLESEGSEAEALA